MDTQPRIELPIADPTTDAHGESKQNNDKTTFKPTVAVDIPVKGEITHIQPGMSDVNVLERVFSDGSDSDDNGSNDSEWVRRDKSVLSITDKMIIESGDELTDQHIQMAQYLLKSQFPLIGGLTLKQRQRVIGCTANTIQITYCSRRKHWIMVSTKGCPAGEVNVYDSIFDKLDYETRDIVKRMFSVKNCSKIKIIPVRSRSYQ